jgi:hypothetical protein
MSGLSISFSCGCWIVTISMTAFQGPTSVFQGKNDFCTGKTYQFILPGVAVKSFLGQKRFLQAETIFAGLL